MEAAIRNKVGHDIAQVILAVFLTLLTLFGLAIVGLKATPVRSDEIEPLVAVGDDSEAVQQTRETAMIFNPTVERRATATPSPSPSPSLSPTASRRAARTPTPVSVVVNTQTRAWVFYGGPSVYVRADAFAPLALATFPRPTNDNGRGLDWFPTTFQTRAVVERFIPELVAMRIRWVVILQGVNDWDLVANDFLVGQLIAAGIMPIMRIDRQVGAMDYRRLGWIIARYRERGVRYFQIFNEPNLDDEWGTEPPHTPERFSSYWIQAAEVVAANGGLPGLAPMSPKPDRSDLVFFRAALEEMKRTQRYDLINTMWIAVHNYGDMTAEGFFRYRLYDAAARQVFGASLPILATEGGLENAEAMSDLIAPMYRFVQSQREPYLLAFAPWLIGNAVGGGHDSRWESAAWFTGTLVQVKAHSVVEQAKRQ